MDFNLLENRIAQECPFFKTTYDVPNFWTIILQTINGEYSEYIIIRLENVVRETKKRLQSKSINFNNLDRNKQYLECRDTFLTLIVNILERIKGESKTFRDILENKYVLKTFLQYMAEKYTSKPNNDDVDEDKDYESDDDNEEYFDAKSKGGKSKNKSKNKPKNKSKKNKKIAKMR